MIEIIEWAAKLKLLYDAMAKAARAKGMSVEEFNDAVAGEIARLDGWLASTNKAEDDVFGGEPTKP